jgi:hypothetical protein
VDGAMLKAKKTVHNQATITIENNCIGYSFSGTMYNYGDSGMYIESDYAPRPDTRIKISIDNLPFVSAPHVYFVKVIWRKQLTDDDSPYSYRIGVKYC